MTSAAMPKPTTPRPPVRPARALPALREHLDALIARAEVASRSDLPPLRREIADLCEEIARANPVSSYALRVLTESR